MSFTGFQERFGLVDFVEGIGITFESAIVVQGACFICLDCIVQIAREPAFCFLGCERADELLRKLEQVLLPPLSEITGIVGVHLSIADGTTVNLYKASNAYVFAGQTNQGCLVSKPTKKLNADRKTIITHCSSQRNRLAGDIKC